METRCIGIVTGGAGGEIYAVAREGVDTYITGEAPHWAAVAAEELGINLFLGGHYATETFGVKALAAELSGNTSNCRGNFSITRPVCEKSSLGMLPFITFALFLLLVLGVVLTVPVLTRLQRLRRLIDALTERVAALEKAKREPVAPPVPQKVAIPPSPLLAERRDSPPRVPDERKLVPPAASDAATASAATATDSRHRRRRSIGRRSWG